MDYGFSETSGTTGDPKKIVHSREGELFRAEAEAKALGIGRGSRLAHDRTGTAGWHQQLIAWVSGATLVKWPGPEKISLRTFLMQENITHLHTTASAFRWICGGIYKYPTIQHVDIGGEMVDWADFELLKRCFGEYCTFSNRYATAETWTVTRKYLSWRDEVGDGRMPVGKPVEGVSVALLDSTNEIIVSSPCMAEGYYNDYELTRAKFRNGWYHTSDKGYWLPNGELMHCGRIEMQVRSKESGVRSEETHDERMAKWTLAGG